MFANLSRTISHIKTIFQLTNLFDYYWSNKLLETCWATWWMFELLECCRQCDCTSIRVHISLPWSVYPRVFTVMSVIHTHKESQCPLYLVPSCFISCIQMTFLGHRILFAHISFLPSGQKPYQHFCDLDYTMGTWLKTTVISSLPVNMAMYLEEWWIWKKGDQNL